MRRLGLKKIMGVKKGKGDVRAERAWRRRESWGRVYNVGVLRKRRVGCWEMGAIEVGPSQVVEFMSLFLERIGCRVYTFHRQDLGSRFAI